MQLFKYWKKDLSASIVVFFVALPLCLGVALASGAPPFSGLIAGIIGGIVVGLLSKSPIGVSGPAAGLVALVYTAIQDLGSYQIFLVAVVLAGIFQVVLGILRMGIIGYYFPSSVIKGMLSAIGITIFFLQIPVVLGLTEPFRFSSAFIRNIGDYITIGSIAVALISLFILIFWEKVLAGRHFIFKVVPGPLVAVAFGVVYQLTIGSSGGIWGISQAQLVSVPIPDSMASFLSQFMLPDFSGLANPKVYITAVTIAVVASLETLLSVEATDKLDPLKRNTPTNNELLAQGAGNTLSGLIGGLPITQVIVRSSANVMNGGISSLSTILHGFWLLLCIIVIPKILNLIPNAVLASILLIIGFKLANPWQLFSMYKLGRFQFIPFVVTIIAIVATDLLKGILLGLAVGIVNILIKSHRNSHYLHREPENQGGKIKITLAEEVSFINKGAIQKVLDTVPDNSTVELDFTNNVIMDYDILEVLDEFATQTTHRGIHITLISEKGIIDNPESIRGFFGHYTYDDTKQKKNL